MSSINVINLLHLLSLVLPEELGLIHMLQLNNVYSGF